MANDELDALDALEKEAKEYDKVSTYIRSGNVTASLHATDLSRKDAEIDRILKEFRLDA